MVLFLPTAEPLVLERPEVFSFIWVGGPNREVNVSSQIQFLGYGRDLRSAILRLPDQISLLDGILYEQMSSFLAMRSLRR